MSRGSLIVISGASGVGKSTVIAKVLESCQDVYFSVSCTTRPPRAGEVDGVNYHFISRAEFEERVGRGEFLEYAEYVGNYYGTSRNIVEEQIGRGIDVILDIEVQGATQVKDNWPEARAIFIVPPSFEELARRLRARKTESEEKIAGRLQRAREEYKEIPRYDYIVINDKLEKAAEELQAVLIAERCRMVKRIELIEGV